MSETTKHYQEAIVGFVAARGYRDGYTDAEFAVRQALKMLEEAAELADALRGELPYSVLDAARRLGEVARQFFDEGYPRGYRPLKLRPEKLRLALSEADDIVVTLACLAEAAGDVLGERHDLMEGALAKSRADVARGKRGA